MTTATSIAAALQTGVLPEGFGLPPLVYTVLLVVGVASVAALLYAISPPVRNRTVVAFAPWMMTGGVLHAIKGMQEVPDLVEPLLGTPAVYATVTIVTGVLWIVGTIYEEMGPHSADRLVGVVGTGVVVTLTVLALFDALQRGRLDLLPTTLAIIGALVAGTATWIVLSLVYTDAVAVTSLSGALVVFAHAFDGVSTAVGHDVLDAGERTPISARILEFGETLPTAEYIGAGWLFLLVKLLLASVIVVLFHEWVRETPQRARLVLAIIAALGLGPAANNLLLFAISG